jgi:hypothetical protein
MKIQQRYLNFLSRHLYLDDFYVINIYDDKICFQGRFENGKVLRYSMLKTPNVDDNGYVRFSFKHFEIILT